MRRTALLVALVLFSAFVVRVVGRAAAPTRAMAAALPAGQQGSFTLQSVPSGGMLRWYWVFEPAGIEGEVPVVVAFHGGGGNAETAITNFGIVEEADARGWIAVFPEGSGPLAGPPFFTLETWNAGDCCVFAMENDVDDVGFFEDMLAKLGDTHPIDRERVFATGLSNGGMMTYRIAVERPDLVRAVAPVAASLETHDDAIPLPTGPVPILAIFGLLDEKVPFEGGVGNGVAGTDVTSQPDSILPFVAHNGGAFQGRPFVQGDALLYVASDAPNAPLVADTWYFLALDGGHSCPGGPGAIVNPDEPVHQDVPATPFMFDFFERQ